jgi:response regulator RpfG family c-di-GMP phosphodiesterase
MRGTLSAAKERFPDPPVVILTAVHDVSIALSAIRNGTYDCVLKPFDREQPLAMVRSALENRRLKLDYREYQNQTNLESSVTARTEQLRHALATLERSYGIGLEGLRNALDLKDADTEGHSKRISAFIIAIARAMELPADRSGSLPVGHFFMTSAKWLFQIPSW